MAQLGRARAELARWTGDPAPETLGDPPRFSVDPIMLRATLDQNPTLSARAAYAGQAEADVRLARAEERADWGWDIAYQRRADRHGDMVSAGGKIGRASCRERVCSYG